MKTMKIIYTILVLSFVALNVNSQSVERITIPDDVFYYQPAASVHGAEAAWVNPSGIGRVGFQSFQFMADNVGGDYARSWGMVSNTELMAIAYRQIDNPSGKNYKEWIYASGFRIGTGQEVGFSYRYFKEGPGLYNKRHFWNVGLSGGSSGVVRWAALFSNLNRGRVNGERTEIEQRYSLAYRQKKSPLTLAVDMMLSTGTKLKNAEYVYFAEYIPKPGIYVNATIDSHKNWQIGARVNLLKYFVGQKTGINRHGSRGRTTVFVGYTNQRQPSILPEPRRRLRVQLGNRLSENPPQPIFGRKRSSFTELINSLYRAATDNSIQELFISLRDVSLGLGQAQEVREAITHVRKQGKQVICYLPAPGNLSYFVATAADKIIVPPVSQVRLTGLRAELTFYAGTLEKLGVKADIIRIGKYKSAPESYTRESATEENKEQINRLLDDLFDQLLMAVVEGRGLTKDSVAKLIDSGPLTSTEALEAGLVDKLSYEDNLSDDDFKVREEIAYRSYLSDSVTTDSWYSPDVIAVVVAEGEINQDGGSGLGPFESKSGVTPLPMRRALSRAADDSKVRGIVLRVNSPGGIALAGEEIHHAIEEAAKKKPIVVSMGNVAASGGYYVAMAGSRLFANSATVTGSIGIYGGKADLSGLYKKISLGKELYTRGKYAGMLSSIRPFSDDERTKYYSQLNAFYDHFVGIVSDNRRISADSIDTLARGRVWTGREALSNGLVDEIGGVRQSINYLAGELGLDNYEIKLYPRRRPIFIFPGRSLFSSVASIFGGGSRVESAIRSTINDFDNEILLTRMPYDIEFQ